MLVRRSKIHPGEIDDNISELEKGIECDLLKILENEILTRYSTHEDPEKQELWVEVYKEGHALMFDLYIEKESVLYDKYVVSEVLKDHGFN